MTVRTLIGVGLVSSIVAGGLYRLRNRLQRDLALQVMSGEEARQLLQRVVPLVRLPISPDELPQVLPDGSGLRCPTTGTVYPYRDRVLDLLPADIALT